MKFLFSRLVPFLCELTSFRSPGNLLSCLPQPLANSDDSMVGADGGEVELCLTHKERNRRHVEGSGSMRGSVMTKLRGGRRGQSVEDYIIITVRDYNIITAMM